MLTTSDDGTARLWDCRTGRQIGPSMIHKGAVIAAAFSPDGKRIVTAGTDNAARLWEANTGKQIGVFDGRFTNGTSNIGDVVYSPDGKHFLIIDMSGFEKMWKIPGDLDIPSDLFKLQMQVTTGVQLNLQTNELEIIPAKAWYKLKSEYEKKAEEHSARCKHPEYNLWKRFQVP
jgi:WD40 repeat protein